MSADRAPSARFDGLLATDLCDVVDLVRDPDVLDRSGWWAVVGTFEGALTGYRFGQVRPAPPGPASIWAGPKPPDWRSSMDEEQYRAGVETIREHIAAGDVYQVNLCRLLAAPLPPAADPLALADRLAGANPAPYQGVLDLGEEWIVTASPELFLSRDGDVVHSAPIKGTAEHRDGFADKDFPENIMITDLVRNDLGRVAAPGSVVVTELVARQQHPGLAHLVSTVRAQLAPGHGWGHLLAATFPPGSVSGAPKIRALHVISTLEPVPRGTYCGTVGYVDADRRRARLAVGIRTFYTGRSATGQALVYFGTGAGITWSSDPAAEWAETELKAARLVRLASGSGTPSTA